MRLQIKFRFLLLFLFLLFPGVSEGATKAAVIVGISDYPETSNIPDLQFAGRDAQNFSDFLKGDGYQPYTLIDGEATKENLKVGIDAFARAAIQEEFEQVIFYFSGRGTRVPDERMPPDEVDGLDECLLLGDAKAEQVETYLRDDELLQLLARIRTDVTLLILDCSFSGDAENGPIKGLGDTSGVELDGVNPTKEGDVEFLQNALILSASKPDEGAGDGVLMPALLTALDLEEVDTTGDRRISVGEIHQYLKGTPSIADRGQTPQLFDPRQLNPILAVLPTVPTLQIISNPSGADIFITPVKRVASPSEVKQTDSTFLLSDQAGRQHVGQTPLEQELKPGKYRIEIQKSGFRRGPIQEIELTEYNKAYTLVPATLRPIEVHGIAVDASGKPADNLLVEFQQNGNIVDGREIGEDGAFYLSPNRDTWLQLDQAYSVTVTGRQVMKSDPVTFTFTGYEDLYLSIPATLDTTPPELVYTVFSSSRTVPDADALLPGDNVWILIIAGDAGLGMETASLAIRRLGTDELLPLKSSVDPDEVRYSDKFGVYRFQHTITETSSAAEEWSVAQLVLKDKAGNSRLYYTGEIPIHFTVFPNALAMGESYFKREAYTNSLDAFGLTEAQTDYSRYLTALAYYGLKSIDKAVDTFLTIVDPSTYLAFLPPDSPPTPRPLLNRLRGRYREQAPLNRKDPEYFVRLALTAEALNRQKEAALHRKYREELLYKEKTLIGERIKTGVFVADSSKVATLNGESKVLDGTRWGAIINDTFSIGLGNYDLGSDIEREDTPGTIRGFGTKYTGVEFEYILSSRPDIHFSVQALIGSGAVSNQSVRGKGSTKDLPGEDRFVIAEPGVNLMWKVTKFARVGIGASYRFISGVETKGVSDSVLIRSSDLIGSSANLTVKVGKF